MAAILAILLALAAHISVAYYLANDESDDGKFYSQLAVTLLEQNAYSAEKQAPYKPTFIRLPGYPLFLAGVYELFGHGDNTPVRIIQGVFNTLICLLAAVTARQWVKKRRRRRKAAWWAFILAALCPFTAIYAAMILTETLTTFLMTAAVLTATMAFKTRRTVGSICWWLLTGLICGAAVLLRPDSGLFAAAIGSTLVITGLLPSGNSERKFFSRTWRVIWQGALFSLAFALVLTPWTIRNYEVFGVFQPLAPTHAEMPGEFVPHGYLTWVRTWMDDPRYIGPALWKIEDEQIKIEEYPARAFDSNEEKARVAALLQQYDYPHGVPDKTSPAVSNDDDDDKDSADKHDDDDKDQPCGDSDDSDDKDKDQADQNDAKDDSTDVELTPEIDAGFAQIAAERIARSPYRYYAELPAYRAAALWFDTHSMYYPFEGQLFPLKDLDTETYQHLWLPLFAALMWVYTLLAALGAFLLLWSLKRGGGKWLLLATLMTLPRILFFASLENPEPRYVVELFIFTAILGGIALARLRFRCYKNTFGVEFDRRK